MICIPLLMVSLLVQGQHPVCSVLVDDYLDPQIRVVYYFLSFPHQDKSNDNLNIKYHLDIFPVVPLDPSNFHFYLTTEMW